LSGLLSPSRGKVGLLNKNIMGLYYIIVLVLPIVAQVVILSSICWIYFKCDHIYRKYKIKKNKGELKL